MNSLMMRAENKKYNILKIIDEIAILGEYLPFFLLMTATYELGPFIVTVPDV